MVFRQHCQQTILSKTGLAVVSTYEGGTGGSDGCSYEINKYDALNWLVKVTNQDAVAEYAYKPDGIRLSKTVDGVTTIHAWDGANIVMDLNGNNSVKDIYIRGVNLIKSDSSGYYVYNAHGDVTSLADDLGVVAKTYIMTRSGMRLFKKATKRHIYRICNFPRYTAKERQGVT